MPLVNSLSPYSHQGSDLDYLIMTDKDIYNITDSLLCKFL